MMRGQCTLSAIESCLQNRDRYRLGARASYLLGCVITNVEADRMSALPANGTLKRRLLDDC